MSQPSQAERIARQFGITVMQAERHLKQRAELLRQSETRRQGYQHLIK